MTLDDLFITDPPSVDVFSADLRKRVKDMSDDELSEYVKNLRADRVKRDPTKSRAKSSKKTTISIEDPTAVVGDLDNMTFDDLED